MRMSFVLALGIATGLMSVAPVPVSMAGEDGSPALAALRAKYDEAKGSYPEKFAAVKADYEAFVKAHPGTEDALEAKLFLFRNTWWEREKGTMTASAAKLADEILAEFPKSPQLGRLVEYQYVLDGATRRTVFEKVHAASPHDAVKAEALLGLVKLDVFAKDEAARKTAKDRLAELSTRYGKVLRRGVTPFAEIAEAILSPHDAAALAVGRPAPEILGRDLDGKPMKLADFRGKVVLLDFWGDW